MGGKAVAVSLVAFLLLSMLSFSPPMATHLDLDAKSYNTSAVNIVFSNGPGEDESVTGLKTITFSLSGTGTIDSILVEIAVVGGPYSVLTNLTGSPWLFNFDSTSYTNGTYTLRASGWDSDVNDATTTTSDEFTIDNHIPEITAFTALSPDIGTGASSTDRAWFNVSQTGTIEFRYGISDDDFDRASLQNVPGPGTPASDGPTSLAYGWDWSTGAFSEGTWDPRLTVFDNSGLSSSETIRVDTSMPELVGWTVDALTTDLIGTANISYSTYDLLSGIDLSSVSLQYGFDSNGVGQTPDLSGQWLELPGSGLDRGLAMANWATKSRQYLMLRATIADEAGNTETTEAQAFQVMPGLDLSWNTTATDVDRLVVRPGETFGNVAITGELRSNQVYAGAVVVSLEAAPADRSATTQWTVMNVQTLPAGSLGDGVEIIEWSYTVPNSGQYDLRVRIDPTNVIDENSEINNDHYMVVTGADVSSPGLVPSFAPTLSALIFVGFVVALLQQRD